MPDADSQQISSKPYGRWLVAIAGIAIVILAIALAVSGDLSRRVPLFLMLFAVMYVLYLASIYMLTSINKPGRQILVLIFAVAVAARAALVISTPTLSDDVYRYLWEGRVVRAGYNPFLYAPDADELRFLRDKRYDQINHKHLETIYPPVAQGAFLTGAVLGNNVVLQKVIFVLFDIATLALLALFLRSTGRNPTLCAVYGWSPLVIIEFSHSGHMDSLAIFGFVLAIVLFHRGRNLLGSASMALSFLAKYFSVVLIPFLVVRRRYWGGIALFGAVAILGYIPFAGASGKLASSLGVYGRHWEFNSLVFGVIRHVVEDSQAIRIALVGVVVLFAFYQSYRQKDLLRYAYLVTGCTLVLSPTVYPWYLCWIVPFLCFYTSRAWLFLTGAVVLSYTVWPHFYRSGLWEVSWLVMLIEYAPFFGLLVYDATRRAKAKQTTTTGV